MVTTSIIASSGALPLSVGHLASAPSSATSSASTIAAVNSLLNSGAVAASATAVTAGKSDSGVGNSPRYLPLDLRNQEEPAAASQASPADAIGGYSLDGQAFPSILYSSQFFAHRFSQDNAGNDAEASSEALKRVLAETASNLYNQASSLLTASSLSVDTEESAAPVAPEEGESKTTGETDTAIHLPVKTTLPSLPQTASRGTSLPGNDNLARPKLVVSRDRSSLRSGETGTGAYRAAQTRNDRQLISLPASTSASA